MQFQQYYSSFIFLYIVYSFHTWWARLGPLAGQFWPSGCTFNTLGLEELKTKGGLASNFSKQTESTKWK